MSWNRTYRPTQIADLHLDFVRTQIQRMMDAGKIPQSLLFAGPKGTGKTSTARIIGSIVNDPKNEKVVESVYLKKSKPKNKLQEPDNTSDFNQNIYAGSSFVVQEMDAASNRGIDDIRQLKTRAFLPPQEGKMSVFILDEAHMLTMEAFNALLKLIEEPPEHVIFILATTELHKIPETIVSRCQLVEFKKASIREITNRLKTILLTEKIEFDDEALNLIAQSADGSFRDAIKLLELASRSGKITKKEVEIFTSVSVAIEVEQLLKHLLNKDEKAVVEIFESLREKSVDQQYFHKSILEYLHTNLLQNLKIKAGESVINRTISQFLLQELSDPKLSSSAPMQHLKLELKILELIDRSKNKSGVSIKKNSHEETVAPNTSYEEKFQAQLNREDKLIDTVNNTSSMQYIGNANLLKNQWQTFLEMLAINNSTLSALLSSAKFVSNQDHSAVIGVYYSFHKEQLSQQKSITIIQDCLKEMCGGNIELEFVLLQTPQKADLVEPQQSDTLVNLTMQALL
jgi:DNA polymerase III subunit gamma/tau